ncbi:EAL and HDOD domain-containing protein [Cellulosilyticum sp. I15G10I2]|uniref:EAL and HDOD domain-containing protein n=1 Tax=Cellulosilyticum sp. I15G10I2 TaxID=1892843 RepID=UPI00085BAF7E|nr:HDOD domain-containing protein [Cellulosilyticum sp. I15G10I2]
MDVYVARQPIFDRRMNVYGYELLYRRSMNNFYEGADGSQATAETINNAFFVMHFDELTSGTRAFINFSEELLEMEIPCLLPKEIIVIEILENIKITEKIINLCRKFKSQGYMLALDDFVFSEEYIPLIEMADIIKVEFSVVNQLEQHRLINKYKDKVKFLAEKIETRAEYEIARKMGYDYFQGYFFSKPVIIKGKEIVSLNINLIRIIKQLNQNEPDYQKITEIIERDLGLSYKLLRVANSVLLGSMHKVYSIKQALVRLGTIEIMKWIYLMMLKEIQTVENKELIRTSLVRGKLMEYLAFELDMKHRHLEFFMTGVFSSVDVLVNQDMEEIVKALPLTTEVAEALVGDRNKLREILDGVIDYEMFNWSETEGEESFLGITRERFMRAYLEALKWVMELDY